MERITLEIDEVSAKKWKYATDAKRKIISRNIEQFINKSLDQKGDDFWKFVDRISKKAADNGCTEEELNQLLNEE